MDNERQVEFIMLVGLPASGKTTLSEKYKKDGYAIFSSDVIRAETEAKLASGELVMPSNTDLNSLVFDTIKKQVVDTLKRGESVVFDATNLGRRRRINFRKTLYKIDCIQTCVLFITPIEECLRRNSLRVGYAKVPDDAMYKMFCNFECPYYWEGWDKIIPVIDDATYSFDFNQIFEFPQDNPHHTLTLDKHMQAAYAFAVANGFSEAVQKTARYHDIGKLYTKRFENRRGEKTDNAHFYGHENYGAYLYLTEMCCGKELTQEQFNQILYETNLINCHMRPLNMWRQSEKLRAKDKKLFGEQFFTDLVNLNKCDRNAH